MGNTRISHLVSEEFLGSVTWQSESDSHVSHNLHSLYYAHPWPWYPLILVLMSGLYCAALKACVVNYPP